MRTAECSAPLFQSETHKSTVQLWQLCRGGLFNGVRSGSEMCGTVPDSTEVRLMLWRTLLLAAQKREKAVICFTSRPAEEYVVNRVMVVSGHLYVFHGPPE